MRSTFRKIALILISSLLFTSLQTFEIANATCSKTITYIRSNPDAEGLTSTQTYITSPVTLRSIASLGWSFSYLSFANWQDNLTPMHTYTNGQKITPAASCITLTAKWNEIGYPLLFDRLKL